MKTRHSFNGSDSEFIGTMNPEAFKLPALKVKQKSSTYDQLSKLSLQADNLRKEILGAQAQLSDTINSDKPTPFCTFKKWLIDFEERTQQREKELSIFAKHLTNFRTSTDPTFVEVDAADEKMPNFDPVSYSLLVSNQQRTFFSKDDIIQQNNELKILICEQQEAISNLRSRLKLFEDFQNQNVIKNTIQSLKEGSMPMALAGAAPTRATELRQKQKLLSKELTALVKKRKELLKIHKAEKTEMRHQRMLNAKAVIIQKVWRGYMGRQYMKKMHNAAVKIQKVVRGFLIRYQQKAAMEEMVLEELRVANRNNKRKEEEEEEEDYSDYSEEEDEEEEK